MLTYFNPRSSCEERRLSTVLKVQKENFNPRSSCEERHDATRVSSVGQYFNPRSSCEERRQTCATIVQHSCISIHAPHARSDMRNELFADAPERHFNPRSSCEERRAASTMTRRPARNFNPRSSCEERPRHPSASASPPLFQSTLLMRGATG